MSAFDEFQGTPPGIAEPEDVGPPTKRQKVDNNCAPPSEQEQHPDEDTSADTSAPPPTVTGADTSAPSPTVTGAAPPTVQALNHSLSEENSSTTTSTQQEQQTALTTTSPLLAPALAPPVVLDPAPAVDPPAPAPPPRPEEVDTTDSPAVDPPPSATSAAPKKKREKKRPQRPVPLTPQEQDLFKTANDGNVAGCEALLHHFLAAPDGRSSIDRKNETQDRDGVGKNFTALHVAALKGHFEVCRLLLCAGADDAILTSRGLTPPMLAAAKGHATIVKLFAKMARMARAEKAAELMAGGNNGGGASSGASTFRIEAMRAAKDPLEYVGAVECVAKREGIIRDLRDIEGGK